MLKRIKLATCVRMLYLKEFIKFILFSRSSLVFFATTKIDLEWIQPTMAECVKRGIEYSVVVSTDEKDLPKMKNATYIYRFGGLFLRYINCKILVTASSGLPTTWVPLRAQYVVHMPHSLVSLHMAYPPDSFAAYNVLFAAGVHHIKEFEYYYPKREIFPVGYGKFDVHEKPGEEKVQSPGALREVLIAPSWGKDNILELMGQELITEMLKKGYLVTVRPHPVYFADTHVQLIDKLKWEFRGNCRFSIEEPFNTSLAIDRADIMISDYSGVAMEFAFRRERPVVFIDVPKKVLNENWGECPLMPLEIKIRSQIGTIVSTDSCEVVKEVERFLYNTEEMKRKIQIARDTYVYNYKSCSQEAVTILEKLLKN